MREIKFRGMSGNGKLYSGLLSIISIDINDIKAGYYISNDSGAPYAYPVNQETIGQFTGVKDKNGVDIYEGDIVLWRQHFFGDLFVGDVKGIVKYEPCSFYLSGDKIEPEICFHEELEVIGNIHENSEIAENIQCQA